MTRPLNLPHFSSTADSDGDPTNLMPALTRTVEARRRLIAGSGATKFAAAAHDLRWLDGKEARLPVLVLPWDQTEAARGQEPWCPVVPLWTDVESAIPGDLILEPAETTTGLVWRAAFNHQTEVPRSFLGDLLGRLTESGVELITLACDGVVSGERTGSEFESAHDPRLGADAWIGQLVAEVMERASEQWAEEDPNASDSDKSAPRGGAVGEVILLRPQFMPPRKKFALAAASHSFDDECVLTADGNVQFDAVAKFDVSSNELRLEVRDLAPTLTNVPADVVVQFRDESQVTVHLILQAKTFVLNSELPVDEHDIKSVEMHLT